MKKVKLEFSADDFKNFLLKLYLESHSLGLMLLSETKPLPQVIVEWLNFHGLMLIDSEEALALQAFLRENQASLRECLEKACDGKLRKIDFDFIDDDWQL
jgi:hypothetical protein